MWQAGMFGLCAPLSCVTVLTLCAELGQASMGMQLPSKVWLADLLLNC